jgi:hypothetical protein
LSALAAGRHGIPAGAEWPIHITELHDRALLASKRETISPARACTRGASPANTNPRRSKEHSAAESSEFATSIN